MTFESAIAFSMALILWVLIPGPAILAIVGRSLTAGLKPALKLIMGILIGDLFYISIVLLGITAVGKILGEFFYIIRILGALYLVFLGIKLWFKAPKFHTPASTNGKPDHYQSFLSGFSITLGNPKAILFHLGFLPTFFDLSDISILDAVMIISIFVAILGGSLVFYAYSASKARLFFEDPKRNRLLNRGAGTMLIGAGVAVAAKN
jgi:threonine/homoserine/homoserine lactone efflux protein